MANTLTGFQFDKMRVSPERDGLLYYGLNGEKDGLIRSYSGGLRISNNGNKTLNVAPGAVIVRGRLVVNTEMVTLTPPVNVNSTLCITINLSRDNTFTGSDDAGNYKPVNNQVSFTFATGSINQEDINNTGSMYQLQIANISWLSSSIMNVYPNDALYNPPSSRDNEFDGRLKRLEGNYIEIAEPGGSMLFYRAGNKVWMLGTINASGLDSWKDAGITIPTGFRPRDMKALAVGLSPNYALPVWGAIGGNRASFTMIAPTKNSSTQSVTWFGSWVTVDDWDNDPY